MAAAAMDSGHAGGEDYFERVGTVRSLDNHGPLEFVFPASVLHLTDLSELFLKLTVKVRRDGQPVKTVKGLTAAEVLDWRSMPAGKWGAAPGQPAGQADADYKLSVCNALFDSLFSQVSVYCNEVLVENVLHYHYAAYVKNLLSWDREQKTTALAALAGWVDDEPGKYEDYSNSATRQRQGRYVLNGKDTHLKAKLALGVCDTETKKLLPNHVTVKLVLHRNPASVPLLWLDSLNDPPTGYSVDITRATAELKRVKLPASALKGMETRLGRGLAAYPFHRTQVKTYNVASGEQVLEIQNMYNGVLPSVITVAFVKNSQFHGDIRANTYLFDHHDLTDASLWVNGEQCPSPSGYSGLDVASGDFADVYLNLYRRAAVWHGLTARQVAQGAFLLVFRPPATPGGRGVVSGRFSFGKALASTVTVLSVATYPGKFMVDNLRQFSFDHTP